MRFFSRLLKFIFSRLVVTIALILFQLAIIIMVVWNLSTYFIYFYTACTIFSLAVVFFIIGKDTNPSFKLPWVITTLAIPIFGVLFYIIFGHVRLPQKYKNRIIQMKSLTEEYYPHNHHVQAMLEAEDLVASRQCSYLKNATGMPVYEDTVCEYLPLGEVKFERLKEELSKAKDFIFLEYFIIQEGKMWGDILEILTQKADEGLDVRVMYDDIGCVRTLPYKYYRRLLDVGIKCVVFNPFRASLSPALQNRDHRKIAVIDGCVGFTGGINLADEYINEFPKHGHWKDCAIMLKGEAVYSLTLLFLEMWNFYDPIDARFDVFKPKSNACSLFESDGYVMPYGDTPLDDEYVGESIYLNIINNATNHIYINTPYFIVDSELLTALKLAAKRGVEIIIVTPHIADKWYVHLLTRSNYPTLIKSGIRVFEYTPGFMHSKTFVCDDKIATVGTVNLDYRSLYHHYECGVWLYKNSAVHSLKRDFLHTLKECREINYKESIDVDWSTRLVRAALRLFAPLF